MFPALVGPKPQLGLAADGTFEQSHICIGDGPRRLHALVGSDFSHCGAISATAKLFGVEIEHVVVEFTDNAVYICVFA